MWNHVTTAISIPIKENTLFLCHLRFRWQLSRWCKLQSQLAKIDAVGYQSPVNKLSTAVGLLQVWPKFVLVQKLSTYHDKQNPKGNQNGSPRQIESYSGKWHSHFSSYKLKKAHCYLFAIKMHHLFISGWPAAYNQSNVSSHYTKK